MSNWKGVKQSRAWVLCVITTINLLSSTSLFTLGPFMVLQFGAVHDKQAVGFWSGVLVGAFYVGRALTAPLLGAFADHYGRCRAIQISLIATSFWTIALGCASSLPQAVLLRFICGACSCVHATCGAMAFEFEGRRGTAWVETGFTVSCLFGPGLGGLLYACAPPCTSQLGPFFAPCVIIGLVQLAPLPFVPMESVQLKASAVAESLLQSDEHPGVAAALGDHIKTRRSSQGFASRIFEEDGILTMLCLNAGVTFVVMVMEEGYVLYGIGELGLDAAQIGAVFSIAGVVELLNQSTLLLWLIEATVPKVLRRNALAVYAIPIAAVPFLLTDAQPTSVRLGGLAVMLAFRKAASYCFFVSNTALLNSASTDALARCAGWRMATGSVAQILGPTVGATAYAWSATSGHGFPFDKHFVFIACAFTSLAMSTASVADDLRASGTMKAQVTAAQVEQVTSA